MTSPLRIYVAGASAELERCRAAMNWVRATPGLELTRDWLACIESEARNGRRDHDLTSDEQEQYAIADLGGVRAADVVWALVPAHGVSTVGMWVEVGCAITDMGTVVFSGRDVHRHIWCSLGERFESDGSARVCIRALARERMAGVGA